MVGEASRKYNYGSSLAKEEIPQGALSWTLKKRQLCDLELLINGAFHPLQGFLNRLDYESVLHNMRLVDGTLWPIPINLDVDEKTAGNLREGDSLVLRDEEGIALAVLQTEEIWLADKYQEASCVYASTNLYHPGVVKLMKHTFPYYVSGKVKALHPIRHYDFQRLRKTPGELKTEFQKRGWEKIIAFQTRNPMHRVHFEMTLRALKNTCASILIHPAVGETKEGDIEHYTRVRCYEALLPHYPKGKAMLSLLPLAMRMAGPREALWHAIIRKNYGCTHFIVGRDHAGPGKDQSGKAFYGHYAAQHLIQKHQEEVGIRMIPFESMQYVKNRNTYVTKDEVCEGDEILHISGTELRRILSEGKPIPEWFTDRQVADLLRLQYPIRNKKGLTVLFTGLSGSGKSTLAKALFSKILENGRRKATLLDGDLLRRNLSSELGFSKEHRDLNVMRIGYVASEVTKHGGIAICAPISPYDQIRKEVRKIVEEYGSFILIYLSTPLEVCEKRDCKGLYARAREGKIKNFTGISDPYEAPYDADLTIDTSICSIGEGMEIILNKLFSEGYIER